MSSIKGYTGCFILLKFRDSTPLSICHYISLTRYNCLIINLCLNFDCFMLGSRFVKKLNRITENKIICFFYHIILTLSKGQKNQRFIQLFSLTSCWHLDHPKRSYFWDVIYPWSVLFCRLRHCYRLVWNWYCQNYCLQLLNKCENTKLLMFCLFMFCNIM